MIAEIFKLANNSRLIFKTDEKPKENSKEFITSGAVSASINELYSALEALGLVRRGRYDSTADKFYTYREAPAGGTVPPPVEIEKEEGVLYIDVTDNDTFYAVVDGHYTTTLSSLSERTSGIPDPIYLNDLDMDLETQQWPVGYAVLTDVNTPVYLVAENTPAEGYTQYSKLELVKYLNHGTTLDGAQYQLVDTGVTIIYRNGVWGITDEV